MKNRIDRNAMIFISFLFGIIIGLRLYAGDLTLMADAERILSVLGLTGISYLYIFRLFILPLTIISVICGVLKMQHLKEHEKLGKKTLQLYISTTFISILMAVGIVLLAKPGVASFGLRVNFELISSDLPVEVYRFLSLIQEKLLLKYLERKTETLVIIGMIIGMILTYVREKKWYDRMERLNKRLLEFADFTLLLAPLGVFSIIAVVFSIHGYDILIPLCKYFLTVLGIYLIQTLMVYPLFLVFMARLNPLIFIRKFKPTLKVAFATSSSDATLPVTMDMLENHFGVSNKITQQILPIGATINMDGAAILYGSATVFLAQLYGIPLDGLTVVGIVLFSAITSVATSGVPNASVFMLAVVLDYTGIPIEGLFFIVGMERVLDMISTFVNVAGDVVCALIIAQREGELDGNEYNLI